MRIEHLDPRKEVPICIETPEGMIEITKSTGRRKGIVLRLPGDMKAFIGKDRALENARFTTETSDGRTVPTYTVLVPVKSPDGSLAGVRPQSPVRMMDSASAAAQPIRLAQG